VSLAGLKLGDQSWSDEWPHVSITEIVSAHALRDPNRVAVIDPPSGVVLTYAQLVAEAAKVAAGLTANGIRPGDVVGVQLPNWWEFLVLYLATSRINAVFCPMSPAYREAELSYMIPSADMKLLVCPGDYRGRHYGTLLQAVCGRLQLNVPVVTVRDSARPAADCKSFESLSSYGEMDVQPADPDSAHIILFTSGTESKPKGVVHTHNTSNYSLVVCTELWGLGPKDVVLVAAPVTHGAGFNWCLRAALFSGAAQVMLETWQGQAGADAIRDHGCTFTYAPTRFLQDLLEVARNSHEARFQIRTFGSGGSPIPRKLVQEARDLMDCTVLATYGQTECFVATSTRLSDDPDKISTTDGASIPGAEVKIVGAEGESLAAGESGVCVTRGPHLGAGYLDASLGTVTPFSPDGWLWTGDTCVMDAEGYIRVVGRVKEIIIRNGRNISPAEVEEHILGLPSVRQVGVVGIPDAEAGESVAAVVVPSEGESVTLEEVRKHLEAIGVARFKWPEHLVLRKELPHSAVGKLRRKDLRAQLQGLGSE
jgi:acyl-CoA synthetase (AMP-forming)/AMP-acid ligase II